MSTDRDDVKGEIVIDDLPPEQILNFIIMFAAQNMKKTGHGEDFILICKHPQKGWGAHSTMSFEETTRVLKLLSARGDTPDYTEVRSLEMEDFVAGGPRTRRTQ